MKANCKRKNFSFLLNTWKPNKKNIYIYIKSNVFNSNTSIDIEK